MGVINSMRRQNAIYWPPTGVDGYGRPTQGDLVELINTPAANYRVRWEDKNDQFIDEDGTTKTSRSVVYVPRLPNGGEVAVGGFLWLGDRDDLVDEEDPTANPGAWEVRVVNHTPNFKATQILREAVL